jgi:hypothetical protein
MLSKSRLILETAATDVSIEDLFADKSIMFIRSFYSDEMYNVQLVLYYEQKATEPCDNSIKPQKKFTSHNRPQNIGIQPVSCQKNPH